MAEPSNPRSANRERTRAEILDVATAEFARRGPEGARVDDIAARTRTTKRMIYYYFGSKEQLYLAVLQRALTSLRPGGGSASEAENDPLGAIVRIARATYDRYRAHPDSGRVMIGENVSGGTRFAEVVDDHAEVRRLDRALAVGAERGLIRPGVSASELLMIIDGLCQFAIANQHSHHRLCGRDPTEETFAETGRRVLADVVTAYLSA